MNFFGEDIDDSDTVAIPSGGALTIEAIEAAAKACFESFGRPYPDLVDPMILRAYQRICFPPKVDVDVDDRRKRRPS